MVAITWSQRGFGGFLVKMGKSVHYRTHGNECTRNLVKFAGNQLVMISFFKICRFFDSLQLNEWLSNL